MAAPAFRRGCISLIIILSLFAAKTSQAQVCDDFSDGDLSSNPYWSGDTADFRINGSNQLQLYTDGADSSQIAFQYTMPGSDTIEWRFWMKLGFTPTANNYAVVALYSDSADLLAATHYLSLAVTNPATGTKDISLFQDDSLLFTFPYHPKLNSNPLRFRIRMVGRQQLLLAIDSIGGTDTAHYADCGTVETATGTVPDDAFFGIYCRYTSSRARLFYFDDIGINSDSCGTTGGTGREAVPGDIAISEILFNPVPGGTDYVELYNSSGDTLSLSHIRLAKVIDSTITTLYPIGEGNFPPHSLIAVTTDAAFVASHYTVSRPDRLLQVTAMPSYNNDSGTVVVATSDSTILDRFDYSASMHSRLLRDVEGVALERRSYERPTQESSNWYSAASTAGYGTPTGRNSRSHETLFVDNDIAFSTTLFSPDDDGYNDLLDISYSLQRCDLAANITVYDRSGRTVRHLARGQLLGCQGTLTWDGTDDNAQPCPRGRYLIVVEAYNENGASQSWRRTASLVRQ